MRHDARATRSTTRWLFRTAAGLMLLYVLNVALGMVAVKLGHVVWRLGDVGEFLLVLSCMAVFVAGLIADEEEQAAGAREEGDPISTEGGVQ